MKKHSLTKKIKKELVQLALELPKVRAHRVPGEPVVGSVLLQQNPEARQSDGKPILPYEKYASFTVASANHFRRLCKAYESGGDQAVNDYVQPFMPTVSL